MPHLQSNDYYLYLSLGLGELNLVGAIESFVSSIGVMTDRGPGEAYDHSPSSNLLETNFNFIAILEPYLGLATHTDTRRSVAIKVSIMTSAKFSRRGSLPLTFR